MATTQTRNLPVLKDPGLLQSELFIDGAWCPSSDGKTLDVTNPANGSLVATVASASREDTVRAIEAAHRALPAWAAKTAKERSSILRRWFDLMVLHADDLAAILTAEQGKPLKEAKGEILYGAAFIEWYAEEAKRIYGETIPHNSDGRRLIVIHQPVGVCAAITPWNFPMAMITRKAGPALAAGCTMVLKPASATPLSALAMGELARRAGIPDGVFSVLAGSASVVGDELATNPIVRKLTFTGSTEVGKALMQKCASTVKKMSLELGGNAPVLVFNDADIETAVAGTIASKFRNTGQTCVCANRILVQSAIYEPFVKRLSEAVAALKVGDGLDPDSEQGPLIDEAAVAKVEEHIADALENGAEILVGGSRHSLGGTFFQPTVISGVTPTMRVAREETFGPLAPVFRFETEEEGIALANATEFGLAAYYFTRDLGRMWRVGEALEFGVVGVNTGIISYEGAPFGGMKESGTGREGSRHGIADFLEIKYLCVAGLEK
ncbi:NAD-dependent succinate-semialdehyde dehydrogenase [Microvirga antarctica]|uniref:NAD-dependent succinate-semialdehyde dehydrogenase n=1 Tax=Microvirga antarctica TaxID=2819233 RepID=UPI002484771D|nr:NAD-dependent succinate-semialdehyde dehydrogenase [Microvirga antarctica]